MLIPNKIKIGAHQLDVKILPDIDINQAGYFDIEYYAIRLRGLDRGPESKQAEALLHELFEAIGRIHNMTLEHKDLTTLSEMLFAVIRDNNLNFLDTDTINGTPKTV